MQPLTRRGKGRQQLQAFGHQGVVFGLARPDQIGVFDLQRQPRLQVAHHNGHAFGDFKHVFIAASGFAALGVAVQIHNAQMRQTVQQALAHTAKGRAFQVRIAGNKTQHASAHGSQAGLRQPDKFDVIVVDPLGVALTQVGIVEAKVTVSTIRQTGAHQLGDPVALVARVARIRRVPHHHRRRQLLLDPIRLCSFCGEHRRLKRQPWVDGVRRFQRVGQKHVHAWPVFREGVIGIRQLQANLHVGNGIRSHHQLEGV